MPDRAKLGRFGVPGGGPGVGRPTPPGKPTCGRFATLPIKGRDEPAD